MTLAQVVYNMSTDRDFAAQLFSDPDGTLAKKGFKLSREELAFLLNARVRGSEKEDILSLARDKQASWR